jgi:hypothetical protein
VESSDFLLNCIISITFVFAVLAILSLSIQLLITVFPEKPAEDDSVLMSAISNHYNNAYPHLRITKIEEQK